MVNLTSRITTAGCGVLLLALGGCQTAKSSTPDRSDGGRPIDGVTITAPSLLEPIVRVQVQGIGAADQAGRPERGTTNGVRPLTYTFEVASDSGFTSKLFSRAASRPATARRRS
jgi:hypothetical protein